MIHGWGVVDQITALWQQVGVISHNGVYSERLQLGVSSQSNAGKVLNLPLTWRS